MGLLTYETKIDFHEGGMLEIKFESEKEEPTISLRDEVQDYRITLTLGELEQLKVIADRFRQCMQPLGE